jgi:glutathione S-transferase
MKLQMKLHGYFRSSASYRVRIALNLKGLSAEHLAHHLRKGEQCAPAFLAINPQGLVPALEADDAVLTQSLAIIEWLDETHPAPPLLPKDPLRRAKVRAFAGTAAPARIARGEGDGLGGMGQQRGPCGLRKAGCRRSRSVLLWSGAHDRRPLPGAATGQCPALRRRSRRVSAALEGRGGGEKA